MGEKPRHVLHDGPHPVGVRRESASRPTRRHTEAGQNKAMIEVRGLTKRYGDKVAVNDLSFVVEPGKVTGFLGPNGAGKTTTMRLILGLDYADAGTVTIDGQQYASLAYPMREVGALID